MIKTARARDLIGEHAALRKQAYEAAAPRVGAMFREAEAELRGCKTAAEASTFDPNLLRHYVEP